MNSMNQVLFYKTKLTITGEGDLLERLLLHIRKWVTHKFCRNGQWLISRSDKNWETIKQGGTIYSKNISPDKIVISSEEFYDEERDIRYWSCEMRENYCPKDGYCQRVWITNVGVEQREYGKAEFSFVTMYYDKPFVGLRQAAPTANVPKLIYRIALDDKLQCYAGKDKLIVASETEKMGMSAGRLVLTV